MKEIFNIVLDMINHNKGNHEKELKNIEDQLAGLDIPGFTARDI